MADGVCDVCGVRPATVRAQVSSDGRRQTLELCDVDYRRLARQQRRTSSPLESLFGGSGGGLFDDFFGDGFFGAGRDRGEGGARGAGDEGGDGGGDERARRSVPVRAGRGRGAAAGVAERLSGHAEEILQDAARRAAEAGRRQVDTEHLLLALTGSDVVRSILDQFRLSPDELRRQVERDAPPVRGEAAQESETGVSPRVKDALSRAFAASREFGHSYVGPEHLSIGLAEEGEGLAADVLRRYGITPQAIRQQVAKVVGRGAEEGRVETPTDTPNLDKYSRDLTKLAREGKLDPVIGRAREIETTIEILARRKKNNPVLIGEPGVGKTAIVEGLAQRIVAGEVPEALADKRLVELSVNSMVAGSKYRGEFEERVRRTAHGQGLEVVFDDTLVEHLAAVGFRPEFGARELRRLIRSELETQLARAMLGGAVQEGDRVLARWDGGQQKVVLEPQPRVHPGPDAVREAAQDASGAPTPDADAGPAPAEGGAKAAE